MGRRAILVFWSLIFTASAVSADNSRRITAARDHARAAIEDGTVVPERDVAPLLDMLRKAKDDSDQRQLVGVISDLGEHDSSSPLAVKRYIAEHATPLLISVVENTKNSQFLRGDAVHALRDISPSRAALEKVTKIALADPVDTYCTAEESSSRTTSNHFRPTRRRAR